MARSDTGGLRDGLTTVTVGTLALVAATLLLVLLNFLSRVLVVRSISTSAFDAYSLGFTLTQVLAAVGAFGVPVALGRSLPFARSDAERRTIVRTSLWTGGFAALAAGGSLAVVGPALGTAVGSSELGVGLEFFAVAVAGLIASTVLAAVFQGFADVLPNALFVQVLNPLLFFLFLIGALSLPGGRITYEVTLAGFATANAATLAALVVYSARHLPKRLPRAARDLAARARFLALLPPLAVLGAMTSLAGSADTLVLGAYDFADVGLYNVGLTLARLVQVGVLAASYVFLPVASQFLSRNDRRAVRLTFATVTKWLTVFSLPLFCVFFFLPGPTIAFVFGSRYGGAAASLEFVVLGAFAGTLLGPGSMTQVALGRTRLVAINATAAGLTDLTLALLLVPTYGPLGAAAAWASANVLFAALCVAELAYLDGLHPFHRDFLLPLLVTVVPVALLFGLVPTGVSFLDLAALALGVAVLFVAAVVATRSIGDGDRLLLESVESWTGVRVPLVRRLGRLVGYRRAGPPPPRSPPR